MYYISTRSQPSTVYEAYTIAKEEFGVSFTPILPVIRPEHINMFIPWSNVDYIQNIVDAELKVA